MEKIPEKNLEGKSGNLVRNFTGVLLSGGRSSRFGSPKAFAEFKGQCMYRYSLEALQDVADEVVISSAPALTKDFQNRGKLKIIEDIPFFRGKGPMAGIYSCMLAVQSEWYIVLPCDMPLISSDILKIMMQECKGNLDGIVVNACGRTQPLVAIYNVRIM
jgi:molybdopterin-guanine dinucleotide biosynthesis protein A